MKHISNIWKTSVLLFAALTFAFVSCSSSDDDNDSEDSVDKTAIANRIVQNMVKVDGGTFTMGYDSYVVDGVEHKAHSYDAMHQVTLSSYYICKYPVTQKEYEAIMGTNPSKWVGENIPVNKVTWAECQNFISALNKLTNHTFRLPTEAEWEFAARGGNRSQNYTFAGSNNINEVAWYLDNSDSTLHAVGLKKPNELGIYDMTGNVCEWCNDWANNYPEEAVTNPTGPTTGNYRILRGGSYCWETYLCAVYYRHWEDPAIRYNNIGFRLAFTQ